MIHRIGKKKKKKKTVIQRTDKRGKSEGNDGS